MKAKKLNTFIYYLIENGIIPGLSILVGREGRIIFQKHAGHTAILPEKEELTNDSIYDLASLTKPLITSFLAAYFVEREAPAVTWETEITHFFPSFPYKITLRQLATHTSGLPAWAPLYLFGDDYLSTLHRIRLKSRPGKRVEYSCLGYILLHYIIREIGKAPFPQLAGDIIFNGLGLTGTFFIVPDHLKHRTAPTENGNIHERKMACEWLKTYENGRYRTLAADYPWRETMIRGETHDINSYHLGGTAGNAGLFSTASDIYKTAKEFFPTTATILKPSTLVSYWKNWTSFSRNHRTMAFRRNSASLTSAGKALSRSSIGHSGFTGTSLWLDPVKETVYILLSNRVHPDFKALNFDTIRRTLHRLLKKEIEGL